MKKLGKIVSVIIILMVVLVIFVITNLDRGIKTAVESIGPEMTQSQVTLSSVDLSLTEATGRFAAADAFKLGEISFSMDADSLASDTIIIQSLQIMAPEITMERADGRSNLDQIQANITDYLGADTGHADAQGSASKFIIRDLKITDGKIHYAILGGTGIDLALPDLHLTDIGQSAEQDGGVSAAEAAAEIITAIVGAAGKAVTQSSTIGEMGKSLEDQVKEKAGALKGLFGTKK